MNRNYAIDLLKIISCFSVVVLHVASKVVSNNESYTFSHLFYYMSCVAVPIFFMVNGYLLLNKKEVTYKYIFRKIIRIIIIILSWNIILVILKFILSGQLDNPFYMAFQNLIQKEYFWQFWFFGGLIIIYLCVPIINKMYKNIKRAIKVTLYCIIVCMFIDFINIFRGLHGESIFEVNIIQTFRIWTWLAYYLLGGILGNETVRYKINSYINLKINWCIFFTSLVISNVYQYNMGKVYRLYDAEYFYNNIFVILYILSLFTLVLRYNFRNNIISFISDNMIGIYVIHVTVIKVLSKIVILNIPIINLISIFIVFLVSLSLSYILRKIPIIKNIISM